MQKRSLFVLFVIVFIDLIGFGIVIPLNPYLARKFGADAFDIGLLMTVYSAMQFFISPFWGQLSDRYGRRPILLMSLLGSGLSHLWFAFSADYQNLFLARAFAGLFAANISTAMAYIADVTPVTGRAKGMGIIGAAFGLGFVLGPTLGGVFADIGERLGHAPPFGASLAAVVAGVICLLNFVLAIFVLKESLLPEQRVSQPKKRRASRWRNIGAQLRKPVVGPLIFVFFLMTLAMAHMEASLFLFVQDHFAWDVTTASYGFAYVGVIIAFTQGFLIRKVIPLVGEKKMMFFGLALFALGLAMVGVSYSVWPMAAAVTFLAIGSGLANPSVSGSISLLSSPSEQGHVMGVNHSFSALGRILGPALGGLAYRDIGHSAPFLLASGFVVVALFVVLRMNRLLPETA